MYLNEKQQKVVESTEGPVLVLAGAGSGKTAVLIERTKRLISLGVSESSICIITFTNKAATEVSQRLSKRMGYDTQVDIGTFHSIALSLLKEEIAYSNYRLGFNILSDSEVGKVIYKAIRNCDVPLKVDYCLKEISKFKYQAIGADLATHKDTDIVKVYKEYQSLLRKSNSMDFDEILMESIECLKNKEVREKWMSRIKYIMVDEYQDTNPAQYLFLKSIFAKKNSNMCCVGDDKQGIYSFRGADINIIMNFENDYDANVIKLEQNYRSSGNIVNASNSVISNNTKQRDMTCFTANDIGSPLYLNKFNDEKEEADFIAEKIYEKVKHGDKYSSFCILFRANKLLSDVQEALCRVGIPYKLLGDQDKPFNVEGINQTCNIEEVVDAVSLITVHSSKGLEFEHVFIVGLEKGCFPSRYMSKGPLLEEERRLMYVAMTRAKATLYISYVSDRKGISCKGSEFLIELPKEMLIYNSLAQMDFKENTCTVSVVGKDRIKHPSLGLGMVKEVLDIDHSMKATIKVLFGQIEKTIEVQF